MKTKDKQQREIALLEANIKETRKKEKGVNILSGMLMLGTIVFLFIGAVNYAVLMLLLVVLGVTASNSLNTRIQLLENDLTNKYMDNVLDADDE